MILKTEYTFHYDELRENLLPVLKDKVFHVTSYSSEAPPQTDELSL